MTIGVKLTDDKITSRLTGNEPYLLTHLTRNHIAFATCRHRAHFDISSSHLTSTTEGIYWRHLARTMLEKPSRSRREEKA